MNLIGIIPARYQSSRFPGKPLVEIKGKTMIQRTWEQAKNALANVAVATDDQRIKVVVESFGGAVVMTSSDHHSGTERCAEAVKVIAERTGTDYDVVINIQGDEPFIQPRQIELLAECFHDSDTGIATLIKKISLNDEIFNPNLPKVIFGKDGNAIYFSRSPIPCIRGKDRSEWLDSHSFYRHIGMYGYRTSILQEITRLEPSSLEMAESLEQNRWLENGYKIKVRETDFDTISIDTPDDLKRITG